MRRVTKLLVTFLFANIIVAAFIAVALPAPAAAAISTRLTEYSAREDVLAWIDSYRQKPDLAAVPLAMKVLSQRGALREPESAGVYVGFLAGILGSHPAEADAIIAKVLAPLAPEDQWVVVRAIAYSRLPQWKALLRKYAPRMPTRQVMIAKYLTDKLPALDDVPYQSVKPGMLDKLKGYLGKDAPPPKSEITYDSSPDLLDTLWGYYFATGAYVPVARIISMLPWSKDRDSVEKLTVGSMAKYTLVSNAVRSNALLAMLKRANQHQPDKEVVPILNEVIEAAETIETARVRKQALAAIDELKAKGPGYRRDVSFWGKVGEGTLALGCIVAAAAGQVEIGLPCVIGGAASSAALTTWDSQK